VYDVPDRGDRLAVVTGANSGPASLWAEAERLTVPVLT
jgi:hypothetical protein